MMTADRHAGVMKQPPRAHASRGFTLIEMLVALTLVALLSAGLFGGLRLGARVWESGGERIAAVNDIEAARTFLRHRLSEAQPLRRRNDDGEAVPVFDGEGERLRFAAPWPPHLGMGGAFVYELWNEAETGALMLDWKLHRPDGVVDVSDGRNRPRRLFRDAGHVNLRYYGRRDDDESPGWHESWAGETTLPLMIELRFAGEGSAGWPPLRAAVAATAGGL